MNNFKFIFPEGIDDWLIDLIKNTESMDDEEKQSWFDIIPSMNDDQIDRLFNILDNEKKQLEEL